MELLDVFYHKLLNTIITNKEFHELNALLPASKINFIKDKKIKFIPKEHTETYYNTYKYYPAYIEIMDL